LCTGGGNWRGARAAAVIRIDAMWLAVEPLDMRAGTETALARVVKVFGAAGRTTPTCSPTAGQPHEGAGARRHRRVAGGAAPEPAASSSGRKDGGTLSLSRAQFDALVLGLPWQRIGEAGVITVL
jgi:transposase